MDHSSIDSARPQLRPWTAQLIHSSGSPGPWSPPTAHVGYHPQKKALSPPISYNMPHTPMTPLPPSSSLTALDAKNIARDFAKTRLDLTAEDKWRRLGARVLPLFNGDHLQGAVEENNEIVRSCLRSDLDSVWHEMHNILRAGMSSLIRTLYKRCDMVPKFEQPPPQTQVQPGNGGNSRQIAMISVSGLLNSSSVPSSRIADAVVYVWDMMYSHILPYLEAVFQPVFQFKLAAKSMTGKSMNVRKAALAHFRDAIVLPLITRLEETAVLARPSTEMQYNTQDGVQQQQQQQPSMHSIVSLLQMLTILASLTPHDRGPIYSTARLLSTALQV